VSPPESAEAAADLDDATHALDRTETATPEDSESATTRDAPSPEPSVHETLSAPSMPEPDKPVRRRSTVREKVSFASPSPDHALPAAPSEPQAVSHEEAAAPEPVATPEAAAPEPGAESSPPRRGWWSRRFGGGN
jgi:ribonuclease E